MIDVQDRISEIMQRIDSIHKRFNSTKTTAGNGFHNTLAEVQEEYYKNQNKTSTVNRYNEIIKAKSEKYSIPVRLIKSVIKQESNFNEKAVSRKGAKGLMQLMPQTAKLMGVNNIFNPEENIEGGVKYLRMMLNQFDGDVEKALAAYNAGPKAVEKYNGVPNYNETKTYISRILNNLGSF